MCVISMVYDYYKPLIPTDDWIKGNVNNVDWAALTKMIADFYAARGAAKVVDEKTGQPDCADPEKAKLEARVAELEKRIAELEPKPTKRRPRKKASK